MREEEKERERVRVERRNKWIIKKYIPTGEVWFSLFDYFLKLAQIKQKYNHKYKIQSQIQKIITNTKYDHQYKI